MLSILAVGAIASGAVTLEVRVPDNVADAWEPPAVVLRNLSRRAIEVTFNEPGAVHLSLEREIAGQYAAPSDARCGQYAFERRVAPGESLRFRLWQPGMAGPGATGRYRIALEYAEAGKPRRHVVRSAPFELRYGDVAPANWTGKERARPMVLTKFFVRPEDGAQVRRLDRVVHRELQRCVAILRRWYPWLRGRFSVSRHGGRLDIWSSTVGAGLSACAGRLRAPRGLPDSFELQYDLPPPV